MNQNIINQKQSNWSIAATVGLSLYALCLFLFPKGYIVSSTILIVMALVAGYYKQLSWHKNLTLLTIACIIFIIPHLINLGMGTTELGFIKKIARGLPLIIVAAFLLKHPPKKETVYYAFASGLINCFIGMLHAYINGLDRVHVLGFNSIPLMITASAMLAFILPQSNSTNIKLRLYVYLAFTLTIATVVISQTKGVTLSVLVVLFVFSIFTLKKSKLNILILWLLLIASTCTSLALTDNKLINRVQESSRSLAQTIPTSIEMHKVEIINNISDRSSDARLILWQGAIELAKEKPLFGYGKVAARSRMLELIAAGDIDKSVTSISQTHFHSIYFEALGNQGIAGVIALAFMLLVPLYIFLKNREHSPGFALAGMLIIVNYMVAGLSDTALTSTLPSITYFVLMAVCISQVTYRTKTSTL